MNQAIFNPWAAPYLNGFNEASPDQCSDVDHMYVWPETNGFYDFPNANETLSVSIILDQGADFKWMGFIWSLQDLEGGTPGFLYRVKDDAGHYISDGFTYCFATPGTLANPFPIFPHVTYAFHQRIEFELINLVDDHQGIQLGFRGVKRFRSAQG